MTHLNCIKHLVFTCGLLLGILFSPAHIYGVWQTPEVISDPTIPQVDGSAPVLKVNPPGNAIAIWTNAFSITFPTTPAIATAFYKQGFGWQVPQVISSVELRNRDEPQYFDNGHPDIAINSSNYAVAVWQAISDGSPNFPNFPTVFAATRDTLGNWSNPQDLNLNFFGASINVSLNENGTALAAWRSTNGANDFISVKFLPFGGSWSSETDFPPFPTIPGGSKPYPFINQNDNAVVTWQGRIDATTFTVEAANYIAGVWSFATLDSGTSNISQDPRCALANNGNAVAIWQKEGFIKAAFFNGASWGAAVTLGDAVALSDNDGPEVVVDPNGNFTATWTSASHVIMTAATTNGAWPAPQAISTPPDLYRFDPYQSQETLAVNPSGDVIAIYHNLDVDDPIFSVFKPFGLPWRVQELVADPSDGFSDFTLNIGLAECGFAAAIWQNGDDSLVYASLNGNLILPSDPQIVQCCQKTASGRRCVNVLTWTPDDCVLFYNIFCNGDLIAIVFNTESSLQFIDSLASCRNCVYTISAVSILGFEGEPVPFVFN